MNYEKRFSLLEEKVDRLIGVISDNDSSVKENTELMPHDGGEFVQGLNSEPDGKRMLLYTTRRRGNSSNLIPLNILASPFLCILFTSCLINSGKSRRDDLTESDHQSKSALFVRMSIVHDMNYRSLPKERVNIYNEAWGNFNTGSDLLGISRIKSDRGTSLVFINKKYINDIEKRMKLIGLRDSEDKSMIRYFRACCIDYLINNFEGDESLGVKINSPRLQKNVKTC